LENYRRALALVGSAPENAVKSKQTHSDVVLSVDKSHGGEGILKEQRFYEADGLITSEKDLALVVFYADCVPAIIADPVNMVAAAVHSGWRGTRDNILSKAVKKLSEKYGSSPANLLCAIGPAIGVCHFEVKEDVYRELTGLYGNDCGRTEDGKFYLDLKQAAQNQLTALNVPPENIVKSPECTYCNETLYSFRREAEKAGRMSAIVLIHNA
jgi:YfiH family protein